MGWGAVLLMGWLWECRVAFSVGSGCSYWSNGGRSGGREHTERLPVCHELLFPLSVPSAWSPLYREPAEILLSQLEVLEHELSAPVLRELQVQSKLYHVGIWKLNAL